MDNITQENSSQIQKFSKPDDSKNFCTFIPIEDELSKHDQFNHNHFNIITYNVLADCYTDPRWFPATNPDKLLFDARASLVIEQIKAFNSDILCLQEFELNLRDQFYKKQLESLGYELFFVEKPKLVGEGCAICVKKEKFKILETDKLDMNLNHEYSKNESFFRGTIAIYVKLQSINNPNLELNLFTTHLYWDPRFEYVKYFQGSLLCKFLQSKCKENDHYIICGDCNSLPESNLIQSLIWKEPPSRANCESKLNDKNWNIITDTYEKMKSFLEKYDLANSYYYYGKVLNDRTINYPEFTNFTENFKGTIDHIIFSKNKLKLKGLLRIPRFEEITSKTFPDDNNPSDHVPIGAVFEFC